MRKAFTSRRREVMRLPKPPRPPSYSGPPSGVYGVHLPFSGNTDSGEALLSSRAEVAEIIGTTVTDLEVLLIGERRVHLSRERQRERRDFNRAASIVAAKLVPSLRLAIYGDVVVTREDIISYEEN